MNDRALHVPFRDRSIAAIARQLAILILDQLATLRDVPRNAGVVPIVQRLCQLGPQHLARRHDFADQVAPLPLGGAIARHGRRELGPARQRLPITSEASERRGKHALQGIARPPRLVLLLGASSGVAFALASEPRILEQIPKLGRTDRVLFPRPSASGRLVGGDACTPRATARVSARFERFRLGLGCGLFVDV